MISIQHCSSRREEAPIPLTQPPLGSPIPDAPFSPWACRRLSILFLFSLLLAAGSSWAQPPSGPGTNLPPIKSASELAPAPATLHALLPGDVVLVKVYLEDDLTTTARIGTDGTITLPLLGAVRVVSNQVEQASAKIRDLLAADYLVNPQVTINVMEFAKRRFTVLGQVQRPGSFEMLSEDSVTLLEALAIAGGYTRIGNPRKVTVQRSVAGQSVVFNLDAEAMASSKSEKPFQILPDDVVVVGEKWL